MKNNNIPNNSGIKGSQIAHMQNQAPRVAARMVAQNPQPHLVTPKNF